MVKRQDLCCGDRRRVPFLRRPHCRTLPYETEVVEETEAKSEDEPVLLANDSLNATQDEALEEMRANYPLYNYLTPSYYQNEVGQTYPAQTARVGV